MSHPFRLVVAAAVVAGVAMGAGFAAAESAGVTVYESQDSFDDVRQGVSDAIVNRGFVIDYEGRIGDMLNRTAADVGADKTVYEHADFLQFCSATLSRAAMEADPANIAFCPYVVFVYELADQKGTTHVGFRHLQGGGSADSTKALDAVNALLDAIAKEAAGQ